MRCEAGRYATLMEQAHIDDRGTHLEVSLAAHGFGQPNFVDVLVAARERFGMKPILVVCTDPEDAIGTARAYEVGVEMSAKLPLARIAIALTRRKTSSAEHFTELVAQNRGATVRYFDSVELAKSWLGVS
jgi:hypothetical protein